VGYLSTTNVPVEDCGNVPILDLTSLHGTNKIRVYLLRKVVCQVLKGGERIVTSSRSALVEIFCDVKLSCSKGDG